MSGSLSRILAFSFLLLAVPAAAQDWIYTVVANDSLIGFSNQYLKQPHYWKQLQKINQIEDPQHLLPGTRLRVPLQWVKQGPVPADIEKVTGEAWLWRAGADGRSLPLKSGMQASLGDRVETAAGASVAVRFADGTLIALKGGTVAEFDQLREYGDSGMTDTRVHLLSGEAETLVQPLSGVGSRFEIRTPSAISAVRGTHYRASSDQRELSRIEVLEGRVRVAGSGSARTVAAGYGTRVAAGQRPERPRALLPAPRLQLPPVVEQLHALLTWPAMEAASGYRAELSEQADFAVLLWQADLTGPRLALPDVPDGRYHLRVRAVDEGGLQGLNAEGELLVDVRPQPPLPLQPVAKGVVRGDLPPLTWSASADARSYRLQLARDAAFTQLLIDLDEVAGLRHPGQKEAELGDYYWRLASIDASGEQGPFGPVRRFQVKPLPAAGTPRVEEQDGQMLASWSGDPGLSYQMQLSPSAAFAELLRDERLHEPQVTLQATPGMVRYMRIRAIAEDGYVGPWGATQRIDPPADPSWSLIPLSAIFGLLLL